MGSVCTGTEVLCPPWEALLPRLSAGRVVLCRAPWGHWEDPASVLSLSACGQVGGRGLLQGE